MTSLPRDDPTTSAAMEMALRARVRATTVELESPFIMALLVSQLWKSARGKTEILATATRCIPNKYSTAAIKKEIPAITFTRLRVNVNGLISLLALTVFRFRVLFFLPCLLDTKKLLNE